MRSVMFATLLCAVVSAAAHAQSPQASAPPPRPVAGRDVCTMPKARGYSPGAIQSFNGEYYRCMPVLGDNATPGRVAWVPVARSGTSFVVKQPVGSSSCTLPTDLAYSAGAFEKYDSKLYRCVNAYGEDLAPPKPVWVEVASTNGDFVK